jgi:hypothetical protein
MAGAAQPIACDATAGSALVTGKAPDAWLFDAPEGGPNWKRSVGWRAATAAVGIPGFRVHDLRVKVRQAFSSRMSATAGPAGQHHLSHRPASGQK